MKSKIYTLIFLSFLAVCARAGDSACTARFYVSYDGNQVYFRAADSLTGVRHYWDFGDTTHIGFGNYVAVTHTYRGPGTYAVTHVIDDPAGGCHDSIVQLITISAPPPSCSIDFHYGHDSTRPNSPYYFYATPWLAGAAADTVSWMINGSPAGTGDTMSRVLAGGNYTICATLSTSLGCRTTTCQMVQVSDSLPGSPDSTRNTDSTFNPGGPNVPPGDSLHTIPPDSTRHSDSTYSDSTVRTDSLAGFLSSYPNPTANQVNLNVRLDNAQMIYIRIYNSMGNQVGSTTVSASTGNNHLTIPVAGLQTGIYYVQLQYGNVTKRSRIQKL